MAQAARQIHRLHILARNRARQTIASPGDFDFAFAGAAEAAELRRERSLIYALNLTTERAIFTALPEDFRASVFAEPFLYGAQLDQAQGAWSVPLERLEEIAPQGEAMAPVLLFSPGRTGSTWIARLADRALGVAASEPDTLTRLAVMTGDERSLLAPALQQTIVQATVASLARYLGPRPLIKLRSQCNARADLLLSALPRARVVFLFRAPLAFASSRLRAFGESGAEIAANLSACVLALAHAEAAGRAPEVLWYETLRAAPEGALAQVLGRKLTASAAEAAADAGDSQMGSGISRHALRAQAADPAILADFAKHFTAFANAERANLAPCPTASNVLSSLHETCLTAAA